MLHLLLQVSVFSHSHSFFSFFFFFFNDTATTEIYTLSLHDALPILLGWFSEAAPCAASSKRWRTAGSSSSSSLRRSEEHTSELQSHVNLVCRLLLEKKKKKIKYHIAKTCIMCVT